MRESINFSCVCVRLQNPWTYCLAVSHSFERRVARWCLSLRPRLYRKRARMVSSFCSFSPKSRPGGPADGDNNALDYDSAVIS